MAKNTKAETSSNNDFKIFLTIATVIFTMAMAGPIVLYTKTDSLQKDISSLRSDLTIQAEKDKKSAALINEKISTESTDIKNAVNQFRNETKDVLNDFKEKLSEHETKINEIKNTPTNVWQIERFPAYSEIVVKQRNDDRENIFGGIGLKFRKESNGFAILDVLDGLPAQKAGLYEGDEIVEVNDEPTAQMSEKEFTSKIRGSAGSTVKLSYRPSGSLNTIKEVIITRSTIDLNKINERE